MFEEKYKTNQSEKIIYNLSEAVSVVTTKKHGLNGLNQTRMSIREDGKAIEEQDVM